MGRRFMQALPWFYAIAVGTFIVNREHLLFVTLTLSAIVATIVATVTVMAKHKPVLKQMANDSDYSAIEHLMGRPKLIYWLLIAYCVVMLLWCSSVDQDWQNNAPVTSILAVGIPALAIYLLLLLMTALAFDRALGAEQREIDS